MFRPYPHANMDYRVIIICNCNHLPILKSLYNKLIGILIGFYVGFTYQLITTIICYIINVTVDINHLHGFIKIYEVHCFKFFNNPITKWSINQLS